MMVIRMTSAALYSASVAVCWGPPGTGQEPPRQAPQCRASGLTVPGPAGTPRSSVSMQAVSVSVATITSQGWEAQNSPCALNRRPTIARHYCQPNAPLTETTALAPLSTAIYKGKKPFICGYYISKLYLTYMITQSHQESHIVTYN